MSPARLALFWLTVILYLGGLRVCLWHAPARLRMPAFALLNLGAVPALALLAMQLSPRVYAEYVAFLVLHFSTVKWLARRPDRGAWVPLLLPLLLLCAVKFVAPIGRSEGPYLFGLSYMAFRLSYLALEVRNETAPPPDLSTYLSFALFLPTLLVGPISPYSTFRRSLDRLDRDALPVGRSLMRVVVGLAKYLFLAQLVNRLGYTGFLLDGHPHSMMDLGIAVAAFYVYLYCNFSGFCDLAIGAGGLVGIAIAENFANPFAARNVREFWNQWHITLSTYMRDMVFTPLSKRIVALAGPRSVPHAIAAAIAVVFLLVGVWHGTGWNFVLFGALHALAVVGNHYYTLGLKELLGKKRFKAYVESRLVRALAVAATWCFVAGSLFFFANDRPHADRIVAALTLRSALYDPVH